MNKDTKSLTNDINYDEITVKNRLLKRAGQVVLGVVSTTFVIGSAGAPARARDATETAQEVISSEGEKEALIKH